jgi:ABC-2 type transport system permease protein
MVSMFTVASKEFSDIVRGKRFLLLVIVFGLVMTAAVANVYLSATQSAGGAGRPGLPTGFLRSVASSLVTMMSYFAPIMGIALGVDAISGEKERGTLKLTLVQPVFRDTLINGKFLAAFLAISLATIIASLVNIGGSVLALGITPTGDDITRLMLFMLFSILFAMTFYGIAAFLSTVSKRTTQSVIISVMLWVIFTFIITIVASLIASSVVPISFQPGQNITRITGNQTNTQLVAEFTKRTSIEETISSFTPNYHYTRIADYILQASVNIGTGPGTRIGPGAFEPGQTQTRTVSIMESLGSAWPNILVLIVVTALTFFASYLLFTRQEIR